MFPFAYYLIRLVVYVSAYVDLFLSVEHSMCLKDLSAVETVSSSPSRIQRDKIEFILFEIPAFPNAFNALLWFPETLKSIHERVCGMI